MTPAQIAEILQGLTLHEKGRGASVASARPDDTGERLILRVQEGGIRRDWEVTVARLVARAGGSADGTRLRAALIILYAEDAESEESPLPPTRSVRPVRPPRIIGRDPVTERGQRETLYEGPATRGGGSVSPGPGDPKLDL